MAGCAPAGALLKGLQIRDIHGQAAVRQRAAGIRHMKIVAGNSNQTLAQATADYLDISLAQCAVRRFADQEIFVEIQENVRGADVFVIQSTCALAGKAMKVAHRSRAAARRIDDSGARVHSTADHGRKGGVYPA